MTATVSKEIDLAGIYLEIEATFSVEWVDNGIGAYEYWGARGVHHDYGWEIGEHLNMRFISCVHDEVTLAMHALGRTNHNRKWKKQHRQWRNAIADAVVHTDLEKVFDDDSICEAASEQNESEPDCDPPDPEPDRD